MTEELNILGKTLKISASGGGALSNTPSVDLGQVSSASFETNKNYTASISGSVSFTLPIPTDTTIENKIIINLNVLATSIIDWGINANSCLSNFSVNKYEIRLLWDNITSSWSAEVLKKNEPQSPVKLFVSFNDFIGDSSSNPLSLSYVSSTSTPANFVDGQFGNKAISIPSGNGNYVKINSTNYDKLNLGTGDFTISAWIKTDGALDKGIQLISFSSDKCIRIDRSRILIIGFSSGFIYSMLSGIESTDFFYITITRNNGTIYFFLNGELLTTYTNRTEEYDFTGANLCQRPTYSSSYAIIQDFVIKNICDYTSSFTPPTSPFVLNDTGINDLHDIEKENVSNKTSDYALNGENTYPNSKALSDAVSYLEGLISDATPPTPDYTNAIEFSKAANVNYTCPSAGWIQIRAATFTASDNSAGYAKISINGNDIRSYYVSNSSSTTYNWSNNSGSNFSGETLIQVAEGDTVKFYAEGFTMSNATFEGTFIPQQSA